MRSHDQHSTKMEEEAAWKEVCGTFNIESLTANQKLVLKNIVHKQDVFLSTRTGSGKSMCYQAVPVVSRSLLGYRKIVLVVSPLLFIMKEQVAYLSSLGFTAGYIGQDKVTPDRVKEGHFDFVFGTPESMVGNDSWREVISDHGFREKLGVIAVDEAHTVHQWYVLFVCSQNIIV